MQHMDLWFDMAIKGDPNLEEETLSRLHLTDDVHPDSDADSDERGREGSEPPSEVF